jgi:uncharacterized protein (TIGR04255 family)
MPRFSHAPVIHTLAQVVFTQVLPLVERIPEIQGRFIKAGYPHYVKQQLMNLAINISPQINAAGNRVAMSDRFQFLHRSRTRVAWVTSNSIVFATSEYEDYERFAEDLTKVLEAVFTGSGGVTEGALIQRVGLRYTDRVVPAQGDTIEEYVVPGLVGFSFSDVSILPNTPRTLQVVSSATTGLGQLIVRSVSMPGPQVLPPDIADSPLTFRICTPDGEKLHQTYAATRPGLTLDFDHFADFQNEATNVELTEENVLRILDSLHSVLSEAFASATTPHARAKWQTKAEAGETIPNDKVNNAVAKSARE